MGETPIAIEEYDPAWVERFEAERERLRPVIGEYTSRIEHVGSTSVPGLGAKPIVDVTAVVTNLSGCWGELDTLNAWYGYEISHVPGDWLLLQRTDEEDDTYNLHLIESASDRWKKDLLFREYLRANPDRRADYERVKREAAEDNPEDLYAYNQAKAEICQSILQEAIDAEGIEVPDPPSE